MGELVWENLLIGDNKDEHSIDEEIATVYESVIEKFPSKDFESEFKTRDG